MQRSQIWLRITTVIMAIILRASATHADAARIALPTINIGSVSNAGSGTPIVEFAPDDDTVVVGGASGKILFYSLKLHSWLSEQTIPLGSSISSLQFASNGDMLIATENDWYLIDHLAEKKPQSVTTALGPSAGGLTLSPDGKYVVGIVTKPDDDGDPNFGKRAITVWSLPTFTKISSVDLGTSSLSDLSFVGSSTIEIGVDLHIQAYGFPALKAIWRSPDFAADGDAIREISPDGETTITDRDIWNARTGKKRPDLMGEYGRLYFISHDLAVNDYSEGAGYYDINTGRCIGLVVGPTPISISGDGKLLACYDYDDGLTIVRINRNVIKQADRAYWNPTNQAGADAMLADAVDDSDLATVQRALRFHADPNSHANYSDLLSTAVHNENLAIFQTLVRAGAKFSLNDQNESKQLIYAAVDGNRLRMLKYLLSIGITLNANDSTPICRALNRGAEMLKLLVDHGCPLNVESQDSNHHGTPLALALSEGNLELANLLIKLGADPKLASGGRPPLHWAIIGGNLRAIQMFADDSPSSVLEIKNALPILGSRVESDPIETDRKMIQWLVDKGADVEAVNGSGQTALAEAVSHIFWIRSEDLLNAGARANVLDVTGTPIIITAVKNGARAELVAVMLQHGADPSSKNKDGQTALDVCEDSDVKQILIDYLRQHNRSPLIQ